MDIDARKRLWERFFDLKCPVNRLILVNVREGMPAQPRLWRENADARVEWSYARYQRQLELAELVDDHAVPHLSMITGTEIFAEALGCAVYRPLTSNPCARPRAFSAEDALGIRIPRVEDTPLMALFDMADKLRARAGREVPLSLPDIQTPADVAALVWEKSDFYASMIEEPDAVKEFIARVWAFLFEFLDLWFDRFGQAGIAHYPDYYRPGGVSASEDEIGVVNPAMFGEFFADDLALLSARYGGIGIHSCADSRHQWANLRKTPGLFLLNLHRNAAQTLESLDFFADRCAMMPLPSERVDFDEAEHAARCHIADARHTVDTVDEARRIVDAFCARYPHMAAYR